MQMIPMTIMTQSGPMITMVPAHMYQQYQYMMMMQNMYMSATPMQVTPMQVTPMPTTPAPTIIVEPVKSSQDAGVIRAKLPDFIVSKQNEKFRIAKGPPSCLDGENFKARQVKRI
jgi:hypothetical protein